MQDQLLGLSHVDIGLALVVFDDEGHLGAAAHAIVLVQIHLKAVDHVSPELGKDTRALCQEADFEFLRLRGHQRTERTRDGQAQRRQYSRKVIHHHSLPNGLPTVFAVILRNADAVFVSYFKRAPASLTMLRSA